MHPSAQFPHQYPFPSPSTLPPRHEATRPASRFAKSDHFFLFSSPHPYTRSPLAIYSLFFALQDTSNQLTTSTSSAGPTATSSPATPTSGPPVGAIVGGTVGGIVGLVALCGGLLLWMRMRRQHRYRRPILDEDDGASQSNTLRLPRVFNAGMHPVHSSHQREEATLEPAPFTPRV